MQSSLPSTNSNPIFRHKEDRWPVTIMLTLTVVDFAMYFVIDSLLVLMAYYLIMVVPKGILCAWNHHHQHLFTFRNTALNRGLEFCYALHTGVTTHLWVLHHVLGHHLNFLDQQKDESRWKRKDGTHMGVIRYTMSVAFTAYPRGYAVGKKRPKQFKTFLTYLISTFLIVGVLVWFKPAQGFFLFLLPMITSLFFTAYVTYDHHTGLDTQNEFEASYNNLNPIYNRLTGNLGYHTAHHHKQGMHWSKLPMLHAAIADKIPEFLYQKAMVTHRL